MHYWSSNKTLPYLIIMIVFLVATGCQASSTITVAPQNMISAPSALLTLKQQLIIKFKPNTLACDSAGIAQLSSATQVTLEYLRPMSGNSCVIEQHYLNSTDLINNQKILKQHPAVEWLEQNTKKKAL